MIELSVADLARRFLEEAEIAGCDLVVEAGAKEASASRRAITLPCVRRAVAFEANPATYARFRGKAAAAGVEYLHLALSDRPGPVMLHARTSGDGKPSPDGRASLLRRLRDDPPTVPVAVQATTLDAYFHGYGGTAALWVDAEGAAGLVLAGGTLFLDHVAVALVEVEDVSFWRGQWREERVAAILASHGLHPVAQDRQSAHQRNVLHVR